MLLSCFSHLSTLFLGQRTIFSVAERTALTVLTTNVGVAASTVAPVVKSMYGVEWLSTGVARENARWCALVAQLLGCRLDEVDEEA